MVQHDNIVAAAGTDLPRAPATGKGMGGRLPFSRWPASPTQTKAVRWMIGLFVVGCAAPSGGFALVANYDGNNVGRIDLGTGAVTFPYTGFSLPQGVAIAPSGGFAPDRPRHRRRHLSLHRVLQPVRGGDRPLGGVRPGRQRPRQQRGPDRPGYRRRHLSVHRVQLPARGGDRPRGGVRPGHQHRRQQRGPDQPRHRRRHLSLHRVLPVLLYPRGVAIAPSGGFALVANFDGNVGRIDLGTGAVTFPYTGFSPHGVAIAPSGGFALVANAGGDNVSRIDLGTGAVTFPYTGFSAPDGVAIALPSGPTTSAPTTDAPTSTIPTTATTETPNQNNSPATRTGIFDGLLMLVVAATMLIKA